METQPSSTARRSVPRPGRGRTLMSPIDREVNVTAIAAPRAGRREWTGLAVLALACLLYAMDLTVLHLAVPSLSADLRPSSAELLWITDIYGFMVAGFLITMGTLGDRIGRRRLLLGIAGATLAPSTLSLLLAMFSVGRRVHRRVQPRPPDPALPPPRLGDRRGPWYGGGP